LSSNNKPDKYPSVSSAGEYYDRGLLHHRAGRLEEAQAGYRKVLQLQPEHADALHMLGVIAYQGGQHDEALSLILRAGKLMPPNAGVYTNLGNVLQARGQLEEAAAAFSTAIKLAPEDAIAHNNLGNALRFQGKTEAAIDSFNRALTIDSGYTDAHVNLAMTYQVMGDDAHAASSYEQAVKLDPGNKPAAHMLAALRGETTDAAPLEHVERLFDGYAERFDKHLVATLGYSMPELLRSEIDRLQGADAHFHDVIDLGCGTGLVGVEFHSICDNLTGIDLSARMIDRARERNVYGSLRVGEVVTSLEADQGYYDLLICADVFPYIGNVQPLFSAVSRHASNGALFAFSTELHPGEGFILHPTGRYAHSQKYLRAVAAEYNFLVITMHTGNLRKHKGQWIRGDLVVLQYQG
jgi:predicted TPR repeat methyltransferase